MSRSIRSTLLLGHAVLLAGVMVAFGGLLYFKVRESTLGAVEGDLRAQARALAAAMDVKSNGRFEVTLSDAQARYFQSTGRHAIWDRDGRIVDAGDAEMLAAPVRFPGRHLAGEDLEVAQPGPGGSTVMIRRSVSAELASLRSLLGLILVLGMIVFAVGFAGGWFLVGRLLDPIRRITKTAATISARTLSSRIDVGKTEKELAELAGTLNGAFDKLEEAFRRQRRFTADAAHELRTPLSILTTQMELALRRPRTSDEYRETIEACLRAVRRMTALAEGLLVLSKADEGKLLVERKDLDLKEVVDEAVAFVRPLADERRIRMETEAASFQISGDRNRLGEAVLNLLTNAIVHNRPEGTVTVTLREGSLTIADTGPGIPAEDHGRVFERFFRADESRSRRAGGAGLGLAITRSIVDAHAGSVTFESVPGRGTSFHVRIPGRLPQPRPAEVI